MSKKLLVIMITALSTSHVTAGSLDVYGDIKINGKTVIDGQGNYVGSLPENDKLVTLSEYKNQSGLKKTYNQELINDNQSLSYILIEDNTNPNVNVITYTQSNGTGTMSSWTSSETYESPSSWVIESHDNNSSDFYVTRHYSRTWFTEEDPKVLSIGESYFAMYEDAVTMTSKGTQCSVSIDSNGNTTYNECKPYETTEEFTTPGKQIVSLLGKVKYKKGDISNEDCIVLQSSSGVDPWTTISCKGIGLVYGWNTNNKLELVKYEGSLQKTTSLVATSSRMSSAQPTPKLMLNK